MGPIGVQEMILIFVLALLLFGPKKLPELGRMLGKGLSEFRRAKNELKATFETHLHELERETRLEESKYNSYSSSSTDSSSSGSYSYSYDDYNQYEVSQASQEPASLPAPTDSDEISGSTISSSSAAEAASTNGEHAGSSSFPVAGTVPRSNGVQPAAHAHSNAEEGHSA